MIYCFQPLKSDVERWCRLCFGRYQGNVVNRGNTVAASPDHPGNDNGSDSEEDEEMESNQGDESREGRGASEPRDAIEAKPPLLSIVAHMDQVSCWNENEVDSVTRNMP